jgi:DNA-binding CsgD family transcriptional regulator
MYASLAESESGRPLKRIRNLLIFCSDIPLARELTLSLSSIPDLRILDTLDNTKGLDAYLQRKEVDFLLLAHESPGEITSTVKPLYPSIQILLLDSDSPYADYRLNSKYPLASQIEKFRLDIAAGNTSGVLFYRKLIARAQVTEREREILKYISHGYSYKRIANLFKVEICTIQKHVDNMRGKVRALDKTHLLCIALRSGLIR